MSRRRAASAIHGDGLNRTVKLDMIIRKLGALPLTEMANVEAQLRLSLELPDHPPPV